MYCTNCGSSNESGVQFCTNCGASLSAAKGGIPSESPQAPASPEAQPLTGQPSFQQPPYQQPPYQQPVQQPYPQQQYQPPQYGATGVVDPTAKSKLVAGLLGIFVGGLGIHRFYLGFNNIGMMQLGMCIIGGALAPFTCGFTILAAVAAGIWGLVDGIMILTGTIRTDASGKPLRD